MTRFFPILAAAIAMLSLHAPLARAETSAAQKREIEKIVRDYLLANPEVIEEAITQLRKKREAETAAAQTKIIEENRALIFESAHQMVLGNPKGTVTLVEFFDYNCGYCKRAFSDMTALIDANPDLRVVIKEFPILSEGSVEAARLSVAVKNAAPQSYMKFHEELFSRPGQAGAAKALEIAGDIGLDAEALKTAAAAPDVTANLKEVQTLAGMLSISGTPSYVIGTELIPGAAGFDTLQEKVTAMRNCGAPVC
jgi:protein-disulfide isomerase